MLKKIYKKVILIFLIICSVFSTVLVLFYNQKKLEYRDKLRTELQIITSKLEYSLNSSFIIVYSIASYISVHPNITIDEFDNLSKKLLNTSKSLKNIVAAPDFIFKFVYPVEGNESIVGIDYRDIPEQYPIVLRVKEERKMILDGPLDLVQGGVGLIARVPIFTKTTDDFWGIASAVLDYNNLLNTTKDTLKGSDYNLLIQDKNNMNFIFGNNETFIEKDSVSLEVTLPDRVWLLKLMNSNGVKFSLVEILIFISLFLSIVIITLLRIYEMEKRKEVVAYNLQRNRDFLSTSTNWIWETDQNFNIVFSRGKLSKQLYDENGSTKDIRDIFFKLNSSAYYYFDKKLDIEAEKWWIENITGNKRCLSVNAVKYFKNGFFAGYRGLCIDITEKIQRENERNEYLYLIDNYIPISQTDLNGVITKVNTAYCNLTGFSKNELISNTHKILNPEFESDKNLISLWETVEKGYSWRGEIYNITKRGKELWLDCNIMPINDIFGNKIGYMGVNTDITSKKELQRISTTDQLTGLSNRRKLDDVLFKTTNLYKRNRACFSVIIIDIDHFKKCNDKFGHLIGDQVLIAFAEILIKNIRITDTVGRWGGEEFLIICPDTKKDGAVNLAEHLRNTIEKNEFDPVGRKTASFGVASICEDTDPYKIVEYADKALYMAKSSGRNNVKLYQPKGDNY